MAEPRVVFGNTVDGMMRKGIGDKLTPALKQKLKTEGLDLEAPTQAAYAYDDWKRWAAIAAEEVYPGLTVPARYHALGRAVVMGIRVTAIGRTVEAMVRLLGPRRTLGRMNRNLRTSDNFSMAILTDLGPRQVRVHINEVMDQPSYLQGVLEAIVELAGGKGVQVEIAEVSLPATTYLVRWT